MTIFFVALVAASVVVLLRARALWHREKQAWEKIREDLRVLEKSTAGWLNR